MKRFILIGLVTVILGAVLSYSAAPTFTGDAMLIADTCTVNIQHTASTWKPVSTTPMIYTMTDTCFAVATVSGYAVLDPGDKLYIGIRNAAGGNDSVVVDTFQFNADENQHGQVLLPFTIMYIDSMDSQTDDTDTLFVNAACGGSSVSEYVQLKNVYGSVVIIDR